MFGLTRAIALQSLDPRFSKASSRRFEGRPKRLVRWLCPEMLFHPALISQSGFSTLRQHFGLPFGILRLHRSLLILVLPHAVGREVFQLLFELTLCWQFSHGSPKKAVPDQESRQLATGGVTFPSPGVGSRVAETTTHGKVSKASF